jgi:hypothetical protein
VAPDGTVYVADPGNHRIQRFTAEGRYVDTVALPLGPARHDLLVEYRTAADEGAVHLGWTKTADLSQVYLPVTASGR